MATLYELTGHLLQLQSLIESGDEIHPDNVEAMEDAIEEKLEGYGKLIRNIESDIDGFKNEEKRIADKRKSMENNVKRLKQHIEQSMIVTNNRKVKASLFTFAIQNNPPSVDVEDESMIPKGYFIEQAPTLNKKELLQDLKLGLEVPGAGIKQTESLRIR